MKRFLTTTASTKRVPALVGGKRGVAQTYLSNVPCTPIDPVEDEILLRLIPIDTPHRLMQTFVDENYDIQIGDVFVVGTREYPVKGVEDWEWRNGLFKRLLLEELRIGS